MSNIHTDNKYICICGKEFNNPQSFNAHKSHCKQHQLNKYGNLDKLNEADAKRGKTHSEIFAKKRELKESSEQAQKEQYIRTWLEEHHICENCGKTITNYYGSGRFCSISCAKSFSSNTNRLETNKKISVNLQDKGSTGGIKPETIEKRRKTLCQKKKGKLIKVYGDTLDITYGELEDYRKEHPVCEICGKPEVCVTYTGLKSREDASPNNLCIDHDHNTSKFRGLLCVSCNSKLGWYENKKENIEKYLNKNNDKGE